MVLKKYLLPVLFVLILSITAISCASTPPEEDTQVEPQTETISEEKAVAEETTPAEVKPEVNIYLEKMEEAKKSAENSKSSADKAKAFKGDPQNYNAAENFFEKAVMSEEEEDFETAAETYYQADEAYKLSVSKTEEYKKAALEAMQAMDNAISNTEKKAEEALKEAEEEDER